MLPQPTTVDRAPRAPLAPAAACLSCEAPLAGAYCAACGQRAIDLAAPTWDVVREAVADATDLDGPVLRTARAMAAPGQLTLEFLRGRRAPYVGPLKLFLLASTALTTTWIVTRGVDARYYGYAPDGSPGSYIEMVVRGTLAAAVAIAVVGWVLGGARRHLLDEAVFAIHLVAALSLWTTVATLLATAWTLAWVTDAAVPDGVPVLPFLLFVPAGVLAIAYVVAAERRVHGGPWWAAV
ncbi:MAG: DUF3667 domain-containing protein, partial [Gemmatirosa sp.]